MNKGEWATWGSLCARLAEMSGKKVVTPGYTKEKWNTEEVKKMIGPFWPVMDSLYRESVARPRSWIASSFFTYNRNPTAALPSCPHHSPFMATMKSFEG